MSPPRSQLIPIRLPGLDQDRFRWVNLAIAAASVAVLSLAMLAFRSELGVLNVMLLFVLLSFVHGLLLDVRASAVGAILSFLAFDLVFIPPYGMLTVSDEDHVLGLFVYLGVAISTALLMARLRRQTTIAIRDGQRTSLLYDLNRSLVRDVTLDQLLHTIARGVVDTYGSAGSHILVADDAGELEVRASWPERELLRLDRSTLAMARHALERHAPAGMVGSKVRVMKPHGSVRFPASNASAGQDVLFVPITTATSALGVLGVIGRPGGGRFTEDDQRLLASFADQVALAIERTRLTEVETQAAVLQESDQLKSAMLAAVSHDLRTPLAAIKASATTLLDRTVEFPPETRAELLSAIEEETDRLTLMVSNLLDLSRIEGGALRPDRGWHDIVELIGDVVSRMRRQAGARTISIETADDLPVILLDFVEISQVLVNLIGNAIQYSPDGSAITVTARVSGGEMLVAVADKGVGIPAKELPRVFETFYRAHRTGPVAGSGIGLAICKGLVEAHRGRIWAESIEGRGTTMTFALPITGERA